MYNVVKSALKEGTRKIREQKVGLNRRRSGAGDMLSAAPPPATLFNPTERPVIDRLIKLSRLGSNIMWVMIQLCVTSPTGVRGFGSLPAVWWAYLELRVLPYF